MTGTPPRSPLRIALALVVVLDAALLALRLPGAPGARAVSAACGLVAVAAAVALAHRGRALVHGPIALLGVAVQSEMLSALQQGASRNFYVTGAALFGWIAGAAYARLALGSAPAGAAAAEEDRAGEEGAVFAIAATYSAAGLSKILAAPALWADGTALRATILAQHEIDDSSAFAVVARAVVEHGALGSVLMGATVVVQLGAFVYALGRRARLVWGTLLLGFHAMVYVVFHIVYLENILLLAAFSYPWARWLRRVRAQRGARTPDRRAPAAEPVDGGSAVQHRALARFALGLGALVAIAWLTPLRGWRDGDRGRPAEAGEARRVSRRFGPVRVGDEIAQGWNVEGLETEQRRVSFLLRQSGGGSAVVVVDEEGGAGRAHGVNVYHQHSTVSFTDLEPAASALVARLVAAAPEGLGEAMRRWRAESAAAL